MEEHRSGPRRSGLGGAKNGSKRGGTASSAPIVAAIDLGTNNCRLLVATPRRGGFRVVDAFSRIVRLGEGVTQTGRLSDAAMNRTIDALKICADKIKRRNVARSRCVATQACRGAANAEEFVERVRKETGLDFDIITTEEEARLGVRGCAPLLDPKVKAALVFDIGGGSTEVSWLDLADWTADSAAAGKTPKIVGWTSIPMGVVSLHERFGETGMDLDAYDKVAEEVADWLDEVDGLDDIYDLFEAGEAHLLGTSGTVTSIAGVHLGLPSYDRAAVDGLWMTNDEARDVSDRLAAMTMKERIAEPCIGTNRAELVVYGCAIYEGIARGWPADRLRIADRGLREGVLAGLLTKKRRRGRRRRGGAGRRAVATQTDG